MSIVDVRSKTTNDFCGKLLNTDISLRRTQLSSISNTVTEVDSELSPQREISNIFSFGQHQSVSSMDGSRVESKGSGSNMMGGDW